MVIGNYALGGQFSLAQEVEDDVVRMRLFGELDLATVPDLEHGLEHAGDLAPRAMVLDLGELTFIDSAGLRAILSAKKARQGLTLIGGNSTVRRMFELTRNEHLLDGDAENGRRWTC